MKESTRERLIISVTWLIRILVGVTFVVSGFVKAIDPWGTLYKFEEYMGAMGLPDYYNLLLVGVFGLCAYEFCVGIFLLTGCFRRSTPIAAILFMAVMLPLTLWIAVADPVDDCGCFGDAIILSNWATFWKNIVLTAAIIWLILYNTRCRCLIRPFIQWLAILGSVGYIVIIGLIGYLYQPLIDFRPFKIGSSLLEVSSVNANGEAETDLKNQSDSLSESEEFSEVADDVEDSPEYRFIYTKEGEEKSFSIDEELPDEESGWIFSRREEITPTAGEKRAETERDSFRIWSEDGEKEMTDEALRAQGGEILLLMPDLKNVSIAMTWQINSLYLWCKDNDIEMIGVVAATPAEIENWRDISMASYPIYTAEDTQIKMLARGNPAVVYLNNGEVVWKSSLKALNTDNFQASQALKTAESFARDDKDILKKVSEAYLILLAVLIFLSILPLIGHLFPSKVKNRIEARDAKISEKEKNIKGLSRKAGQESKT